MSLVTDYYTFEDVGLLDSQEDEVRADIFTTTLNADMVQLRKTIGLLDSGTITPSDLATTKNKGASLWWLEPNHFVADSRDSQSTGTFRDSNRLVCNRPMYAKVVVEKLVNEEVVASFSTRRSTQKGAGINHGQTDSVEAGYYAIDRNPTHNDTLIPLGQGDHAKTSFGSAKDMLAARSRVGRVFHVKFGPTFEDPCYGNVIVNNPLYHIQDGQLPADADFFETVTLPHMHMGDMQFQMYGINEETQTPYAADQPIVRITVGMFYRGSNLEPYEASEDVLAAELAAFQIMPLENFADAFALDALKVHSADKQTLRLMTDHKFRAQMVARSLSGGKKIGYGSDLQDSFPGFKWFPDPYGPSGGSITRNKDTHYTTVQMVEGPAEMPIATCGWHFVDRTRHYGDEYGLITNHAKNSRAPSLDQLALDTDAGSYSLEVCLTCVPLGAHGVYRVGRFGGEEDPAIFADMVMGFAGPARGMGGYAMHDAYYGKTSCNWKWDPEIGASGGYILWDCEAGKSEKFTNWPYYESMTQAYPAYAPFTRYIAGSLRDRKKATLTVGPADGGLYRPGGIIGMSSALTPTGVVEVQQKVGGIFATIFAVVSVAYEAVSLVMDIANKIQAHNKKSAKKGQVAQEKKGAPAKKAGGKKAAKK